MNVLVVDVKSGDPLDVSDRLKQQHAPAAVIVGARNDGTAQLLINLDKSLEARGLNAGDVIREAAVADRRQGRRPSDDGPRRRQGRRAPARGRRARREDDHRGARIVKVLALDYGAARTGVAISDATGTLARPLAVVERAASEPGLRTLVELVAAEGAERIVVGLPLTLKGDHGAQADETAQFVDALRAVVDVPVESFDERFTTRSPPPARLRGRRRTHGPPHTCSRAT